MAISAATAGCGSETGAGPIEQESDPNSLAALIKDGPLPAGMRGGPERPEPPPRFCGDFFPFPPFPFPPGDDFDEGRAGSGVAGTTGGFAGTTGGFAGIPADAGVPMGGFGDEGGASGTGFGGEGGAAGGMSPAGAGGIGGVAGAGPIGGFGGTGIAGIGMGGFAGVGGPGENPTCESTPVGFWRFDDCNTFRTDLFDSSNEGHSAFRTIAAACEESQEGQSIGFRAKEDMVYAPDQPGFSFTEGMTIAAWVNPERITGTSTIARKRDGGESAFALMLTGRKYELVVQLTSGRLVSVTAPAQANRWTHVAGTYDGEHLRLYLDGALVSSKRSRGQLSHGTGPLLIGNDMNERRFEGRIDNVWLNTLAAPEATIVALTCLNVAPTLSVQPMVSDPTPAGGTVNFEVAITNNNTDSCGPQQFAGFAQLPSGFSTSSFFVFSEPIASGETGTLTFDVTSGEETEPDDYFLSFAVASLDGFMDFNQVTATYVVAEPTGCFVRSSRVLTIRDLSVVDDPIRTSLDGDPSDSRTGAWTFGRLMERLALTPEAAPALTESMLRTFTTEQVVNGFRIAPRELMRPIVLDPWPRTSTGVLDLARAPMRLLAIVNRLDLKDLDAGKAGEGRLVFGVLDDFGFPMEFTVIFEYLLPASTEEEYEAWVHRFHALQTLPFPSEEYNAALQEITDDFTSRGSIFGGNETGLIDIRTNEIALSFIWELREFRMSEAGELLPAPLFQTPDRSFDFTETLGRFINEHEAVILAERHDTPLTFEGQPFAAGAVFNNIDIWEGIGVNNPEARHKFSLNTCNGCHGGETNTDFLHIHNRFPGEPSRLSGFLTGTTVFDPFTGEPRRLAELARRRALLEPIVCEETP